MIQGFVLAGPIAAVAWRLQALSASGAIAAAIVGTVVHAGMGVRGSSAMVGYFASSSLLGKLPTRHVSAQQRGSRRDAVQVLANGGPSTLLALLHATLPAESTRYAVAAYYGSVAAATADTWATELGSRWGGPPRSIVTGRLTRPGESGAVSGAGLVASLAAATAIALVVPRGNANRGRQAMSCLAGGMTGSIVDSVLGALVQERFWCAACQATTELPVHHCGEQTSHFSGVPGIDNDVVNFLAVATGGITSLAISAALTRLTEPDRSRVELLAKLTNSRSPGQRDLP